MKRSAGFVRRVMLSTVLIAPVSAVAQEAAPAGTCELQTVMKERRQEVRQRNSAVLTEGIDKKNEGLLEKLMEFDAYSACNDVLKSDLIGGFINQLGFGGQLLENELGKRCKEVARDVSREYRRVMNEEVAVLDDRYGIFSDNPVYREGRTERITVKDALKRGKEAADVARGVPVKPIGRGAPPTSPPRTTTFGEGTRNALKGL